MRFFITVTLTPSLYRFVASDQYDKTSEPVLAWLATHVSVKLMVAEVTKSSNVHYHIICDAKTSESELRYKLNNAKRCHKIIGFIKVEQVLNEQSCIDYCLKDTSLTSYLLVRPAIIEKVNDFEIHREPPQSTASATEATPVSLIPSNLMDEIEWLEDPLY